MHSLQCGAIIVYHTRTMFGNLAGLEYLLTLISSTAKWQRWSFVPAVGLQLQAHAVQRLRFRCLGALTWLIPGTALALASRKLEGTIRASVRPWPGPLGNKRVNRAYLFSVWHSRALRHQASRVPPHCSTAFVGSHGYVLLSCLLKLPSHPYHTESTVGATECPSGEKRPCA